MFTEEKYIIYTDSSGMHVINRHSEFEIKVKEIKSLLDHADLSKSAGPEGV